MDELWMRMDEFTQTASQQWYAWQKLYFCEWILILTNGANIYLLLKGATGDDATGPAGASEASADKVEED